jgi:septal ring factor EnvC (AmiA/AmiB activator)
MQSAQGTNGRRPHSSDPAGDRAELKELRATSRRQLMALDTLSEALSTFQSAAKALEAENAELRADNERLRVQRFTGLPTNGRAEVNEPLDVVLPADDAHVGTNGARPSTAGAT